MFYSEKTEKQKMDERDRESIKAAILKNAENLKLSPQSLSDELIKAIDRVNQHYPTPETSGSNE